MATDMLEKHTFPCEPAMIEKISDVLWYAAEGKDEHIAALRRSTYPIQPDQISWSELRFLGILGKEKSTCNSKLKKAGMDPGFYISCQGDALVLIHQDDAHIQRYVDLCENKPEILEIYNTSLSALNVSSLANLRELYVAESDAFSSLEGLEQLTQLTYLNLCDCRQTPDLAALAALPQLTSLLIQYCDKLINFPSLLELTQLKSLTLRGFSEPEILAHLENLTQLTSLDLSRCEKLTALPWLENLTQLTFLNLSGCIKLTALPGLENLTQLTSLNLSECSSLTALPSLENLTQLTSLNLSQCHSLTALPSLENLTQLTSLKLLGCSSLTALPSLKNLPQLTSLDLSECSRLTALPSLENLTQLPELSGLGQLAELNLSGCGIRELPEGIRNLKSLRLLNLDNLNLRELPDWLPEIAEKFDIFNNMFPQDRGEEKAIVSLRATKVESIPDMSIFERSYDMVVKWFLQRAAGKTQPLNEIKVVFLGDGEAGKSHTIARLMNDGGDPDTTVFDGQSTPGIVIKHKDYIVDGRSFRVNYWDFGGQEIMHSMHRIFLTGRTMYVILLNARDDTQGDRAHYWLHNIQSFAPGAPVLLVLNKIDQNENASVDERDLRGRYDKLTQVVRLSALKYSQEDFNEKFTAVLLEGIQRTGFLDAQWPSDWKRVKEELENMASHYIMGDAYEEICSRCHVDQNQKELLHWFNVLGVSFCYDGDEDYALKDYVILRPDWITNALYIILFNKLEGVQNGLIPHRSIYNILRTAHNNPDIRCTLPQARYTIGDIQYVLGVMRKFNLSFPHGNDHEFIPMLCQQNSTVDVQYYHKDQDMLEFNMEFDYLPNNLLHRLMVERHSELDMTTVWRTGARFQLPGTGLSAVVVIDGNTLRFFVRYADPMHRPNTYLSMLKANVDRIVDKMGLKAPTCQLIYKLDGKQEYFEFELLKDMLKHNVPTVYSRILRKSIPIEDIMNQSAPDGLEDEKRLLDAIRKSCLNIQAESDYYLKDGESGWGMEDKRNRRIRDDLQMLGYDVKDQTQRGLSGTGRGIGELDLLLYNGRKEPWTIIEALRVSSGAKTDWNNHLDKLVANYNYFGASCLYLLTYVDSDEDDFQRIWDGYQRHIPKINPGKFTYCGKSLVILNVADDPQYVKSAKCQYDCGGRMTTAYHIFARIPKHGEIAP